MITILNSTPTDYLRWLHGGKVRRGHGRRGCGWLRNEPQSHGRIARMSRGIHAGEWAGIPFIKIHVT